MNSSICCNNCGKPGHSFHQCKFPITSFGVIAFRYNPYIADYEYLIIRRKDTLGFVDFMRGKYSVYNREYICNMISQMTSHEKRRIQTESFRTLWNELWGITETTVDNYKSEETHSRNKYDMLRAGVSGKSGRYNLDDLIHSVNTDWKEAEWGFPKGRRNYQERDYECAIREFCEETGYSPESLIVLKNIMPMEEIFTGSNMKSYKHKYYIAYMRYEDTVVANQIQMSEISAISWRSYADCISAIRPYNVEKKQTLTSVNNLLKMSNAHKDLAI